jgi:hypothetical protein
LRRLDGWGVRRRAARYSVVRTALLYRLLYSFPALGRVDQFRVPVDGPMSALCGHVRGLRRRAHPDDRRAPALGELDRGEPDPPEAPVTSTRSDPTGARWSMFSAVE